MADDIFDLIIIGAGAAGLMAASEAGRLGLKVLVLESKAEPGAKLLMCGGGRCNATNIKVTERDYHSSSQHILRHVLQHFSSADAVRFFAESGAPLELAPDGCYFSADNNAKTVLKALLRKCQDAGVLFEYNRRVQTLAVAGDVFNVCGENFIRSARAVLITTGGLSYPGTGCDGVGYRLAQQFGHQIASTRPALTPFFSANDTFVSLSGIAVPARLSLWAAGRKICVTEGPFLFTHHGFSGPAVLEISSAWLSARAAGGEVRADFFPSVKAPGIDFLLSSGTQQSLKNVIARSLTERLASALLAKAGVDGYKYAAQGWLTRNEKHSLENVLRAFPLPVRDVAGYAKAEITAGGVDLNELKGATLESRLQDGLFFAGEVLDVDGRIGGFNLHWAWSSAIAAARGVVKRLKR